MIDLLMAVWFSFNIVFGLWTAKNYLTYMRAKLTDRSYSQSTFGMLLDLVVLTSILTFLVYGG